MKEHNTVVLTRASGVCEECWHLRVGRHIEARPGDLWGKLSLNLSSGNYRIFWSLAQLLPGAMYVLIYSSSVGPSVSSLLLQRTKQSTGHMEVLNKGLWVSPWTAQHDMVVMITSGCQRGSHSVNCDFKQAVRYSLAFTAQPRGMLFLFFFL